MLFLLLLIVLVWFILFKLALTNFHALYLIVIVLNVFLACWFLSVVHVLQLNCIETIIVAVYAWLEVYRCCKAAALFAKKL